MSFLTVNHASKRFRSGGVLGGIETLAVNDVSFSLDADDPEIFTVIGESGSGKTTLARMILGLERPSEGAITIDGMSIDQKLTKQDRHALMTKVQPVFQNPFEAFNPLTRVDTYLTATARGFLNAKPDAYDEILDSALVKVGLSLAEIGGRYPHELSGGQLQRVAIARALICKPRLIIADEPVSMVDASLRLSIVNLLRELCDKERVNVIYITHDLATAYYISDRIMIMQQGNVVETGPARLVLDDPQHPYAQLLKSSVLSVDDIGKNALKVDDDLLEQLNATRQFADAPLRELADGRFARLAPQTPE